MSGGKRKKGGIESSWGPKGNHLAKHDLERRDSNLEVGEVGKVEKWKGDLWVSRWRACCGRPSGLSSVCPYLNDSILSERLKMVFVTKFRKTVNRIEIRTSTGWPVKDLRTDVGGELVWTAKPYLSEKHVSAISTGPWRYFGMIYACDIRKRRGYYDPCKLTTLVMAWGTLQPRLNLPTGFLPRLSIKTPHKRQALAYAQSL